VTLRERVTMLERSSGFNGTRPRCANCCGIYVTDQNENGRFDTSGDRPRCRVCRWPPALTIDVGEDVGNPV
jgi:hypothetical protein